MTVVDFTSAHIPAAMSLALQCYEEERVRTPALPERTCALDLAPFAANGLGAAALEDGALVGFLCAVPPFQRAFRSTDAVGVFSPMGANAARRENRAEIYAALYQHAARKWVRAGAVSHGICLYAHDEAAQGQLFRYGFGIRCMDAIRPAQPLGAPVPAGCAYSELSPEEFSLAYPLNRKMYEYFYRSPFFMRRTPLKSCEVFCRELMEGHGRCFVARSNGELCAYLSLEQSGETFAADGPGLLNVSGACCLEGFRGGGLYAGLLDHVLRVMEAEGYTRLSTDFESFNPAGYGFWRKYFQIYTHGVVRRVDEDILSVNTPDCL